VISELLAQEGVHMSASECMHTFMGHNIAYVVRWTKERHGLELPSNFADRVRPLVRHYCAQSLKETPGAKRLLASLQLPAAVVSNSTVEYLRFALGMTNLLEHLEPHVYSSHMVAYPKPAPDVYLHAAERMGFEPADCLVIEDSVSGVTAATRAGMRVAALATGEHATDAYRTKLRDSGAGWLVESMSQVLSIIQNPAV
jgi:HAD superfamily hydrolase (TIGR01509 family)